VARDAALPRMRDECHLGLNGFTVWSTGRLEAWRVSMITLLVGAPAWWWSGFGSLGAGATFCPYGQGGNGIDCSVGCRVGVV